MPENYIGLISGTSMDGIDAVVASFGEADIQLRATHSHAYPDGLRQDLLLAIRNPSDCHVDNVGALDRAIGQCFRDAALTVMKQAGLKPSEVHAIGSHGQTLRHMPDAKKPFSLQLGDPATIATGTGIATVADFRRADIAVGGQGAPLTPPFHEWLFGTAGENRAVLNIGGIANLTRLGRDGTPVIGFDTGPGNTLLDRWIQLHRKNVYDANGAWAATGTVNQPLLERLLSDEYFSQPPPKSTGFEHFNLEWLMSHGTADCAPEDVQATLAELTAQTIAGAIETYAPATHKVFVCGGGVHNADLLKRLSRTLPDSRVSSTSELGLDPDWVEAAAFAWLAMRAMHKQSGNLPSVTGASRKVILGAIHSP